MAEPAAGKQSDRSTSAPVIYEARDGVSWITLNRPSVLNALDTALAAALAECVERAAGDAATFVVVVRGAGRAFCSGMDRTALAAGAIDESFYRHWIRALNLLEDMPKVAIAVLHGYSIGGGLQLAVACDLRLATSDAVVGLGASHHGIIPDGSVLRLARLIGLARAKELRGFVAVRNVGLRVRRGSIHALIGPNGAGKTTCFNLLTHFLTPTAGRIRFNGRDITGSKPAAIARMGLVRSFQISAVFPHLSVLENVRIALQRRRGASFDFWRSERVLDALNGRAVELIDAVGLAEFAATPAVELPYGRKRALEIATTLALDPERMLLDRPTAGMP